MFLPKLCLVLLLVCSLRAQDCLPVVTLSNATLTQVNEPLQRGNFFQAPVFNPANPIVFKVFPMSGSSFRYDLTLIVYAGKCTSNNTGSEYVARSKSSAVLQISVPEANAAEFTARVISNNGGSYEIQYCERACEEPCLDDCSTHGYCNTTAQECTCFAKWTNPSCSDAVRGKLTLLGSRLIAIVVVFVLPVVLAVILIVCTVSCWFQNRRKARRTAPVIIYQRFPYEVGGPNKDDGSESQPLIVAPTYY